MREPWKGDSEYEPWRSEPAEEPWHEAATAWDREYELSQLTPEQRAEVEAMHAAWDRFNEAAKQCADAMKTFADGLRGVLQTFEETSRKIESSKRYPKPNVWDIAVGYRGTRRFPHA